MHVPNSQAKLPRALSTGQAGDSNYLAALGIPQMKEKIILINYDKEDGHNRKS